MTSLRHHLLTPEEIDVLVKLVDMFRGFEAYGPFREQFKRFLADTGNSLQPKQLFDLCKKRDRANYHHLVLLYDFTLIYARSADRLTPDQSDSVRNLREMRSNRVRNGRGPVNISDILDLRGAVAPMPDFFSGKFFGYRRSSTAGHVIRFTLDVERLPDPKTIKYTNRYWRSAGGGWHVRGVGGYICGVIYLAGHAKSFDGKRSLGLRLMTMVPWGNDFPIFSGVLLTNDDVGPIGARYVLVPKDLHCLSDAHKRMTDEEIFNQLCRIDDASATLEKLLPARAGAAITADQVYELISNISVTVIKGRVSTEDDRYRKIISVEREFRELCTANNPETDYRDMMYRILRDSLDRRPKG